MTQFLVFQLMPVELANGRPLPVGAACVEADNPEQAAHHVVDSNSGATLMPGIPVCVCDFLPGTTLLDLDVQTSLNVTEEAPITAIPEVDLQQLAEERRQLAEERRQ